VLLDENHPVYIAINNNFFIISSMIIAMFAGYLLESYSRSNFIKTLLIDRERKDNEQLLLNILPQQVAEELKKNPKNTACGCHEVTILFADLVDFTAFSTTISPDKIVEILNLIFSLFDHLIDQNGLEKIKTIGDSYMAAGGLPMPRPDHAEAVADMALNILKVIEMFNKQYNYEFNLRIGIHSGPVVAGVIGKKKFIYDVWGDTVNTASRMESYSLPGHIQVSADTYQLLKNKFSFQRRGLIDIKGKGKMETYFLIERA
jgi:class 3 adenylate cyclase